MKKEIINEEQMILDNTVYEIDGIIKSLGEELKNNNTNDVLLERTNRNFINRYQVAKNNPYFGRIDIYEDGKRETYYIGYSSIAKEKSQDIVYSWKSSIGDLYAQFHGGESEVQILKENNEKYNFNVLFKRALQIEELKVKKYSDTISELAREEFGSMEDNVMHDDFLIDILNGRNNETQLKDIVTTIQREQNEIIRLPIDNSIIVQGVAGSGKSSIALTRISYLLTRYRDKMVSEDIGILAPNEMFINYIKGVMPTLEIENIPQFTFKMLSKRILDNIDTHVFVDPINNLSEVINGKSKSEILSKYKNSLEFKNKIDSYLEEFKNQFINNIKEFKYFDPISKTEIILSHGQIIKKYDDLSYLSLMERNHEIFKYVENWVDSLLISKQEELKKEFDNVIKIIFNDLPKNSPLRKQAYDSIEKVYAYRSRILREELNRNWKEYKASWEKFELISVYKRILVLEDLYQVNNKDVTNKVFKKHLEYDDLSPLIYLKLLLYGTKKQYKHIVVDEAQDLSPFQVYILKLLSNSMTLLGDVTQNLYMEKGINNWTELIDSVFSNDKVSFIKINTSYRSTNPIMEGANLIAQNGKLNAPTIVPIGRKGEKISIEKLYNPLGLPDQIISSIKSLQKKGLNKIAVVHKDLKRSVSLHERLVKQFSSIQLVTDSIQPVTEDVIIIPSFLTKGLEFDAVIIPNANSKNYGENELDAKLLFVSITRAQHYVKVFYHQQLSSLMEGIETSEIIMEEDYSFL